METSRVQMLNDEASLEVTETVVRKKHYREADLLRHKMYFESLIANGQAGLANVEEKLNQIRNAK